MKKMIASALLGLMPVSAVVLADPADQYFSKNEPKLTAQERAAVNIGKRWSAGQDINPYKGPDGSITWAYFAGKQYPVVCSVLQVCDIALEPGENVNGLNVGDPRFTVEPAVTGSGDSQIVHLILKPLDVGLNTTLVLTTDRRTYHFRLISTRHEMMPYMSFTFPEKAMDKWKNIQRHERAKKQRDTIPQSGEYLGDLDFNYSVSGNSDWKPSRVYNDGKKTIIQMPKTLNQGDAPALLVVEQEGGMFSSDKTRMVNYRLQGDRYIVDTVFNKAILLSGVGSSQQRVTISREK